VKRGGSGTKRRKTEKDPPCVTEDKPRNQINIKQPGEPQPPRNPRKHHPNQKTKAQTMVPGPTEGEGLHNKKPSTKLGKKGTGNQKGGEMWKMEQRRKMQKSIGVFLGHNTVTLASKMEGFRGLKKQEAKRKGLLVTLSLGVGGERTNQHKEVGERDALEGKIIRKKKKKQTSGL